MSINNIYIISKNFILNITTITLAIWLGCPSIAFAGEGSHYCDSSNFYDDHNRYRTAFSVYRTAARIRKETAPRELQTTVRNAKPCEIDSLFLLINKLLPPKIAGETLNEFRFRTISLFEAAGLQTRNILCEIPFGINYGSAESGSYSITGQPFSSASSSADAEKRALSYPEEVIKEIGQTASVSWQGWFVIEDTISAKIGFKSAQRLDRNLKAGIVLNLVYPFIGTRTFRDRPSLSGAEPKTFVVKTVYFEPVYVMLYNSKNSHVVWSAKVNKCEHKNNIVFQMKACQN